MKRKYQSGFTLLEILATMLIFSLLATLSLQSELKAATFLRHQSSHLLSATISKRIRSEVEDVVRKGERFPALRSVRIAPKESLHLHPELRSALTRYPAKTGSNLLVGEELSITSFQRVLPASQSPGRAPLQLCLPTKIGRTIEGDAQTAWIIGANEAALRHGQMHTTDNQATCPYESASFAHQKSLSFRPLFLFPVVKQEVIYLDSIQTLRRISFPKYSNQPIAQNIQKFNVERGADGNYSLIIIIREKIFRHKILSLLMERTVDNLDLLP